METSHKFIEIGASVIDCMAVALIVGTFLWASVRFLVHSGQHTDNPFEKYKLSLG